LSSPSDAVDAVAPLAADDGLSVALVSFATVAADSDDGYLKFAHSRNSFS